MSNFERDRERLQKEFDTVLEGVYPGELRSYVGRELSAASQTPALLCLLGARATGEEPDIEKAAGIQFVHAGLDATRRVLENPDGWEDAGLEPVEEDMVLLAADVLVTVGFDYLLDHYEDATRVVNTFGEYEARARDADDPDEAFENSAKGYAETYTTAVGIGVEGETPDEMASIAGSLALADHLELGEAITEEERERVSTLNDELDDFGGPEAHVEAIRDASAVPSDEGPKGASVEAQD